MQYTYSLKKDISGTYYIKFLNFFDKSEFRHELLLTLKEIIPNWMEIEDSIEIIDSDFASLIETYKKDGIIITEDQLGDYSIDNYVKTDIGMIDIKINGKNVEIEAKENMSVLKTISTMLEGNSLFKKIIDE